MGSMLNKNKELNNMTTFTKNQIEAIKLFNLHVEDSDFGLKKIVMIYSQQTYQNISTWMKRLIY